MLECQRIRKVRFIPIVYNVTIDAENDIEEIDLPEVTCTKNSNNYAIQKYRNSKSYRPTTHLLPPKNLAELSLSDDLKAQQTRGRIEIPLGKATIHFAQTDRVHPVHGKQKHNNVSSSGRRHHHRKAGNSCLLASNKERFLLNHQYLEEDDDVTATNGYDDGDDISNRLTQEYSLPLMTSQKSLLKCLPPSQSLNNQLLIRQRIREIRQDSYNNWLDYLKKEGEKHMRKGTNNAFRPTLAPLKRYATATVSKTDSTENQDKIADVTSRSADPNLGAPLEVGYNYSANNGNDQFSSSSPRTPFIEEVVHSSSPEPKGAPPPRLVSGSTDCLEVVTATVSVSELNEPKTVDVSPTITTDLLRGAKVARWIHTSGDVACYYM